MRLMGFLFLVLTFLAGVTVGTIAIGLINIVVFLGVALVAVRYLEPRFGNNGLVFGMAGAFFASFLWPVAVYAFRSGEECVGAQCAGKAPSVKINLGYPA